MYMLTDQEDKEVSENASLRSKSVSCWYGYMISRPFFTPRQTCMRMNQDHMASGHFVLGRDVLCEFDFWPLAISMPPTKVP